MYVEKNQFISSLLLFFQESIGDLGIYLTIDVEFITFTSLNNGPRVQESCGADISGKRNGKGAKR